MPEAKTSTTQSEESTNSVSREEFDGLLKRVDSQSGILGKISKTLEKIASPESKPPTQSPEEQGIEARMKRVEERNAALDQREQTTKQRIIRNNISRALADAGVIGTVADDLSDVLLTREKDRFILDDATETVSVKSGEESINLGRWAGLFLMSERGKPYLGEKKNPKVQIPKPGDTSTPAISPDQIAKDPALRQEFKATDPEGYQRMQEQRFSPEAVIERAKKAHGA